MTLKCTYLVSVHFPHKPLEEFKVVFLKDRIGQPKVSKAVHSQLRLTVMVNPVRPRIK